MIEVLRRFAARRRPVEQRRPSISVVCGTNAPGPMVAANLRLLRHLADTIIVGADSRVSSEDLAWYDSVADLLLVFPFTGSNQFRGWLRGFATDDWILFLDGDELPSDELISTLPSLLNDRSVGAYAVPTKWVYPSVETWISSHPWYPDRHTRLVRNDDRLWFPATKHSGPAYDGPTRRTPASLLHLDLALRDYEERRLKVRTYEAESLGLTVRGVPINAAYYLPEECGSIEFARMSPIDLKHAREAVTATTPRKAVRRHAIRPAGVATLEDIRSTLPWASFTVDDAQADLRLLEVEPVAAAGVHIEATVNVRNCGNREWPCEPSREPRIRLSYRWESEGRTVVPDGLRTLLPHNLAPGEETDVDVLIQTPSRPGSYLLTIDLVAEGHRWFQANCTAQLTVTQSPRQQIDSECPTGVVPLSLLTVIRRSLLLDDALALYLSAGPVSRLRQLDSVSATPQELRALVESPGRTVSPYLRSTPAEVLFLGDEEALASLVASSIPIRWVLATGETNAQRIRNLVQTRQPLAVTPVMMGVQPETFETISPSILILAFSCRTIASRRLDVIEELRSAIVAPLRVLIVNGLTDLGLALAEELRVSYGATVAALHLEGSGIVEAVLSPSGVFADDP